MLNLGVFKSSTAYCGKLSLLIGRLLSESSDNPKTLVIWAWIINASISSLDIADFSYT